MGTIAITGAASGIGQALANRLKRDGHDVIGIDVQPTDIVADLGTPTGRKHAADAVAERCAGRLDGLVSGAALGPYSQPDPILRVNYFGALQILDDLKPLLAQGREPAAVAISSIGAIYADVLPDQSVPAALDACLAGEEEAAVAAIAGHDGNAAYCVAKRGLALKVRAYAQGWGDAGVRLNAICPGRIATPMLDGIYAEPEMAAAVKAMPIPLGRSAPPEEMASVIAFLLGSDARYVHGAILHADGGSDSLVRPTAL
jgi:NAD(P)-dependent dehydrogenase (short-subunit alcohol dehydrogenase family)